MMLELPVEHPQSSNTVLGYATSACVGEWSVHNVKLRDVFNSKLCGNIISIKIRRTWENNYDNQLFTLKGFKQHHCCFDAMDSVCVKCSAIASL